MNRFKLAVIFVFMAFSAKAQMSYFGADMNLLRSKSELLYFGDFDIKADVQFSVIDNWLFPDRDSKFRFGDLMGLKVVLASEEFDIMVTQIEIVCHCHLILVFM